MTSHQASTAALWLVLVISAIANAATSAMGLNVFLSVGAGVVTLACGVALVVRRSSRHQ